jgi:hypothetical protein
MTRCVAQTWWTSCGRPALCRVVREIDSGEQAPWRPKGISLATRAAADGGVVVS